MSPSITRGRGSGHPRHYAYGDLIALEVIRNLVGELSLEAIRPAATCIQHNLEVALAKATLVLVDGKATLVWNEAKIIELLAGKWVLTILDLGQVVGAVDVAVAELQRLKPPSFAW